jgi:hypothetical protein
MDVDIIEDTLSYMSTEEYLNNSNLGVEKRRQVRDVGYSRMVSLQTAQKKAREEAGDQMRMDLEIEMYANPAQFDIGKVTSARNVLGQSNVTALIKAHRTLTNSDSGVSTPAGTMESFQTMMFDLEFGSNPEGVSYQQRWKAARDWVAAQGSKTDKNGNQVIGAKGTDLAKMNIELARLRDEPQTNIRYKDEVKALDLLILRYDSSNPFSVRPDPSSSPAYLEALQSLRDFVNMEGPDGDIQEWHRKNVPQFLTKEAKNQFLKLPPKVQQFAVQINTPNGTMIDKAATQAKFESALKEANNRLTASKNARDKSESQAYLDNLKTRIALWDAYVTGAGAAYVQ